MSHEPARAVPTAPTDPVLPARPRPHPWIPVLRADRDRVLIGADAHSALPAEDSAAVRAAAAAADGRATREELVASDPIVARGLRLMAHHGALVDAETLAPNASTWSPAQREQLHRAQLSHAVAGGPRGAVAVARRSTVPVRVFGTAEVAASAAQALVRCGLTAAPVGPRTIPTADVLAVNVGRMTWGQVHEWTAAGVTHLAISPRAASVRVGPLVVPGTSACLQCLHLARRDRRPHWQAVSAQLPRTALPCPDPLLFEQAWTLAARFLVAHLQHDSSPAHNAYWEVSLTEVTPRRSAVDRHPLCGCWWPRAPQTDDEDNATSGTGPAGPE